MELDESEEEDEEEGEEVDFLAVRGGKRKRQDRVGAEREKMMRVGERESTRSHSAADEARIAQQRRREANAALSVFKIPTSA